MNKKIAYWTCGSLMVLCLAFSLFNRIRSANTFPVDYTITTWMLLDVFAARPVFYGCLGFVCALRLFGYVHKGGLRIATLIIGIVMTLLFAGVAGASIALVDFNVFFFALLRQTFQSPGFFVIPGILLGLGLKNPSEAE